MVEPTIVSSVRHSEPPTRTVAALHSVDLLPRPLRISSKISQAQPGAILRIQHIEILVEPASVATPPTPEASGVGEPPTWDGAIAIWDGIPGIGRRVAEQLVAELGLDLHQLARAAQAARWAKWSPGTNVSAGKRSARSIGQGNQWLRSTPIQAAQAAVKVNDSYLAALYHRLVARRGVKQAIVAVARKIVLIAYTLLRKREPYQERGANAMDERRTDQILHRMQRRIAHLGYTLHLEPLTTMAA